MIDSGASRHFTGYKEALSNLIEKKTNLEIILGDNATYSVKRIGTVTLHLNQVQTLHLQEVFYVPDLKKNLVSIFAMEDKGFKVASPTDEPMPDVEGPMDPIDPPSGDPSSLRKRPL